jgi:cytochrome bd-type quinol oxidase subunit 2
MITTFLVIITALFGIYFALSGMEAGIALLYLIGPGKQDKDQVSQPGLRLFTPIWEITNVFLVFGFTGLAVIFSNSLTTIAHDLLSTLIIGLIAIVLRTITVLYLFYYRGVAKLNRWLGGFFLAVSMTVPISFGLAGIYLLTGSPFWLTDLGWFLAAILVLSSITFAVCFAYFQIKSTQAVEKNLSRLMYFLVTLYCLAASIGLQLVVKETNQIRLQSWPYDVFILLVAILALVEIVYQVTSRGKMLWTYFAGLSVISPILWALSNRPFLMYPHQYLVSSYSASAYAAIVLIALAIIAPLIIVGFGLLIWLVIKRPDQVSADL